MNYNIFRGEKVRLRARTPEDIERDKARAECEDYDTETDRLCDDIYLPNSAESRKDGWENQLKTQNTWDNCSLVIESADGVPVGGIGVSRANQRDGVFSYGLAISREHWRKGYAREAIVLLLNYYFNELRFHKCNVIVFDYNDNSKALHTALGFVEEGRQRESKFTNGRHYDVILYGITKDEFNARHDVLLRMRLNIS